VELKTKCKKTPVMKGLGVQEGNNYFRTTRNRIETGLNSYILKYCSGTIMEAGRHEADIEQKLK
jgi:hypothetical protein